MLLLLLPVLLLHLGLGEVVDTLRQDWGAAAMPPRMAVTYLREMKAAPPPLIVAAVKAPIRQPAAVAIPTEIPAEALVSPIPMSPMPVAASAAALAASTLARSPETVEPAASAVVGAAADDAEPGPEWPLSTRLSYALTGNYRGAVTGNATVEWLRQGRRYQVHLDLSIGPSFAPLISRRMSSEGELGPRGIAPQRYDEDTKVLFTERKRLTLHFQDGKVTMADGHTETVPAGVQDASSQFVQLTWLFATGREAMRVGHVLVLPLVLPKRQYLWRYEVLGEELLLTPFGPLATWHLRPTRAAGGGDLSAEVWLAPSLQYLPVRLRIRQDEQTYLDLMLNALPMQAAP